MHLRAKNKLLLLLLPPPPPPPPPMLVLLQKEGTWFGVFVMKSFKTPFSFDMSAPPHLAT
jgi:hypothetical protein